MADQTPKAFKLNTGASIPAVGLGTWKAEKGVVGEALKNAVKVGYRHIDCAYIYGNQKEIGKALHDLFENNVVQRKDLWITSKLWNTDHDPEDVPQALERTLADLQLDYLDLYLIHWPVSVKKGTKDEGLSPGPDDFAPVDLITTWHAMESLLQKEKVRAIGVSNFSIKKLEDLLSHAKVVPAVNQVECNPKWQQAKLREYCKAKGIHLSAYSPLGSSGNPVLQEPVIKQLAQRLEKTPAQVALRWGIQVGTSVLPKSTSAEHLKSNIDVFDWSIPEHELSQFTNIDQVRQVWGKEWINKGGPYKSYEDMWDENAP